MARFARSASLLRSSPFRPCRAGGARQPPPPTLWAHFGATAYAQCSAANAQEFEDIIATDDEHYSVITVCEAALELGDVSTYRGLWSSCTDDDTDGPLIVCVRTNPTGEARMFVRKSNGSDVLAQSPVPDTSAVVFDGQIHLVQLFDVAVGANATIRAKVDGGAVETLNPQIYKRNQVGILDLFSPAGDVRGPTPTLNGSILGWVYLHVLVNADLEADAGDIYAAYTGATNLYDACQAIIAAIEDAGHTADIIFAQVFRQGDSASHGDDATLVNEVYTREGVAPT